MYYKRLFSILTYLFFLLFSFTSFANPPESFMEAKRLARDKVFYDWTQSARGTLYCGCTWEWTTRTGGKPHHNSCQYQIRKLQERAERTEWEHIVPAWSLGHQRQCWQNGGRKNCQKNDPVFKKMEANLHNLDIIIGEVNADRNHYRFGMVSSSEQQYGACTSKTDFKNRIFEPRNEAKGMVARVTFYMSDYYNLTLSKRDQRILMQWDKQFPVTEWEILRDKRIAKVMKHHNPFVTGEKKWILGFKTSGKGVEQGAFKKSKQKTQDSQNKQEIEKTLIIANKNSNIYHLPNELCPNYDDVAPHNRLYFKTEQEAQRAGFRKAKNCRQ